MTHAGTGQPGVIVVAEPAVHALVSASGAAWNVQAPMPSIAAMWAALSSGELDQRSRILVFSDSLKAGTDDDAAERAQTARALVAMANAGARVFILEWRPEAWPAFEESITGAAQTQGIDAADLAFHRLAPADGGRALLESMRGTLAGSVTFPESFAPEVDVPLARQEPSAARPVEPATVNLSELSALKGLEFDDAEPAPPQPRVAASPPASTSEPARRPILPPVSSNGAGDLAASSSEEYPAQASLELLGEPKRPGQVTITVTSSKGGSGKSTVSILLAAAIARASAEAGKPLSVCLLDLDTRDGQVASLIGKFMPTALNIRVQPVWDEERIRRNLVRAEGMDVDTLLAPIRPRTADTVGPDFYRTIVRSLQRMYDVIVMDTSVQYLEPLIADVALKESDEILFVTTLASTAVQGMARALREMTAPVDESGLGVPREKIGIIVNQSVANVGMERDQVLAAGLGVPVVGVVPLATKDVLTATNLNRMHALLDHPLLGPAYNELARACLPGAPLSVWEARAADADAGPEAIENRRRGLFRK